MLDLKEIMEHLEKQKIYSKRILNNEDIFSEISEEYLTTYISNILLHGYFGNNFTPEKYHKKRYELKNSSRNVKETFCRENISILQEYLKTA